MREINDGGPAFPEPGLSGLPNGEFIQGRQGMTLRDYFAARAMEAYLIGYYTEHAAENPDQCALWAYEQADSMLKARAK